MRQYLLTIVIVLAAAGGWAHAQTLDIPLDAGWGPCPEWTGGEAATKYDYSFQNGAASLTAEGGGRTMIWLRYPKPRLDVKAMRFVSLRYRATNIDPTLFSYLLYLDTGDSGGMYARNLILGAADLVQDGRWHTATTQLYPFGEIGTLALRFRALENKQGKLEVSALCFSAEAPLDRVSEIVELGTGQTGIGGKSIPVPVDTPLDKTKAALRLGDWFTTPEVTVQGVNFTVPTEGNVSLSTLLEPRELRTVPVGARAQALYLLLGANFPPQMLGYAGWAPGDMTDRPEQFHVQVNYATGGASEQVPYCLNTGRRGLWRGLNAYSVPVDPAREVKSLDLCDGMRTSTFHLVALTAGDKDVTPGPPLYQVHTPPGAAPKTFTPAIKLSGDEITVFTLAGELHFNRSQSLRLAALANYANPGCTITPKSLPLLAVSEQKKPWPEDAFKVVDCRQLAPDKVQVRLSAPAQQAEAVITMTAGEELKLQLQFTSLAPQPRSLDISFPQVQFAATQPEDLWYFYPGASAVWSNADTSLDQPYSGNCPIQLEEVYDRTHGGGMYLATRDRDLRQRYFALSKAEGLATLRVDYRSNPPLPPNQSVTYPATVLGMHRGDFHAALAAYDKWLKTWYAPSHQRPAWYKDVWNFRTWWTHTMGDQKPEYNLLNLQTMEYQTDKFLARDREQFGQVDMIHFFDWRWTKKYGLWGDYAHYDEELGGLDKFRGMIKQLQDQKIRVGLYLDTYLVSRKSDIGKAHGPSGRCTRVTGQSATRTRRRTIRWSTCASPSRVTRTTWPRPAPASPAKPAAMASISMRA